MIVGSTASRLKPKTMQLVFVVSPLSTRREGERAKTGWLGIRMMCPSGDYVRKWSLHMLINVLMYKVQLVGIFPIVKKHFF
jgi:hypothetical protein